MFIIFTFRPKFIFFKRIAMKDREFKPIFVGPSLGMSILCSIPLVALKLFGIFEISWIWVLCPLWFGWVVCFVIWLWFSSLSIVCKCIKPVFIPVFIPSTNAEVEKKEEEKKDDGM